MKRKYRWSMDVLFTMGILIGTWHTGSSADCSEGEIKCADGSCIPESKVKDGVNDCPNGIYDEDIRIGDNCANISCEVFVPDSTCDEGKCRCIPGHYPNNNLTVCLPRRLGSPCLTDPDCSDVIDSSVCLNQTICGCDVGYEKDDDADKCRVKSSVKNCTHDAQCLTIPYSFCDTKVNSCTCIPGYRQDGGSGQCVIIDYDNTSDVNNSDILEKSLNESERSRKVISCRNTSDCSYILPRSECNNSICLCTVGYILDIKETKCVEEMSDNDNNLTTPVNSSSDQLNDPCNDNGLHCPDIDKLMCISGNNTDATGIGCGGVLIGSDCQSIADCTTAINNSVCDINSKCVCNTGFTPNSNRSGCISQNIPCEYDTDCSNHIQNGVCTSASLCDCKVGFKIENMKCTPIEIFDNCSGDLDCISAIDGTRCENGSCVCNSSRKLDTNTGRCVRKTVGDGCHGDQDCSIESTNTHCYNGTCACNPGYKPEEMQTSCVRLILGDPCVTDFECETAVSFARCDNVCVCSLGYYAVQNMSSCTRRTIGDACSVLEDCDHSVNHSICNSLNQCECAPGFHDFENGTSCILLELGDICNQDIACTSAIDNSVCNSDGKCTCKSGFVPNIYNSSLFHGKTRG
ncbi:multiple epidermal growth factor-like domains protein 10 [Argopecten irradians]|uniref:multiple epidermal growth factor-like domains protein 10 n=1 Tax=Argopecten irradians TaxID=31199 RepID=UPI0037108B5D